MSDRPPSPPTPSSHPTITNDTDADSGSKDRIVATTPQLVDSIEASLDCRLDEGVFEDLLVELDRQGYIDWLTVTRSGAVAWDLTNTSDRVADAIAAAVVDRVAMWLES